VEGQHRLGLAGDHSGLTGVSRNSWADTSTTLPSRQIEIGRPSRTCASTTFSTAALKAISARSPRGNSRILAGGLVRFPILRNQSFVCVWLYYTAGWHAFARFWRSVGRNPWRERDDPQKEHVTVWAIFPASSRYWPHNMRGALFAGVWGGSPGLYGRGKQCFLFRFCALALVGAGQDFRGALRMRKGNPPGTASGRRARDYQKCNRDVSRNLPHRGCDGS
jgi:hypothetical protein